MKNTYVLLAATTIAGLVSPAYAQGLGFADVAGFVSSAYAADETKTKVDYKSDGGYEAESTSEGTTADGTKHKAETNVDVDVNSKGLVDKTVTTESSADPKGILNKKKDTAKSELKEKDRGGYKQTVTRKHTDAEGTNVTAKETTEVEVDKEGNVTETTKTEEKIDPKGLMNQKKVVSKSKKVNGELIEQTKKEDN